MSKVNMCPCLRLMFALKELGCYLTSPSFGVVQAALAWAMCGTQQLAAHLSQRLSPSS